MGGRLNKLLSLGGVVLRHKAGYYEHIDALAKPYSHYIPLEYDLSDLIPKVEWLKAHDAEAKAIADRARELALKRMRLEDHICYVWRALEALASKTISKRVDSSKFKARLQTLKFVGVPHRKDARSTLEAFWGTKLDDVR